jgi:hypothetical protein
MLHFVALSTRTSILVECQFGHLPWIITYIHIILSFIISLTLYIHIISLSLTTPCSLSRNRIPHPLHLIPYTSSKKISVSGIQSTVVPRFVSLISFHDLATRLTRTYSLLKFGFVIFRETEGTTAIRQQSLLIWQIMSLLPCTAL